MGRIPQKSNCDELSPCGHKRNVVCSGKLLKALTVNHGPVLVNECEVKKVVEPQPEPANFPALHRVEAIKRLVCRQFNVPRQAIESATRKADIVRPRQICMYLARKHTDHSYPEIGRRLGGRDHTTIIHAYNKIESLIPRDADLAAVISDLEAAIT